jgi:dUTP pyrophosphatase
MAECNDHIHRKNQLFKEQEYCLQRVQGGLLVKKLDPLATIPTISNPSDAGYDLYSTENRYIGPRQRALIKTGIAMAIPDGYVGLIWPRSGLSVKHGVDVLAGVVDSGYRGEVGVCLFNSSELRLEIKHGDRIAQILFQPVSHFQLIESEDLSSTNRGEGGFGSTGK